MSKEFHLVTELENNERIDKLMVSKNTKHSRAQIQSWILNGFVLVNGKNIKSNYRCQIGDEITWMVPENKPLDINPENIPLEIIYEDEFLFIVNKPRGMVIYPTNAHPTGTLVNALLNYTDQLSQIGGHERPGIVHRLDKDTSGLLVIAKDDKTHQMLSEQFSSGKCERTYEAIVHGVIDHETGIIDAPIARDPEQRTKMAVVSGGREAITHFRVIERYDQYTYVECQLKSGRTHQIRVHMNYINHNVVGDPVYMDHNTLNIGGQALYAKSLGFIHPKTKQHVHYEIDTPNFIVNVLNEIRR